MAGDQLRRFTTSMLTGPIKRRPIINAQTANVTELAVYRSTSNQYRCSQFGPYLPAWKSTSGVIAGETALW